MPPRQYFFRSTDGKPLGPYNLNTVAELIRNEKVRAATPVSLDGQNFQPTKSLPELAILLSVDVEEVAAGDDLDEALAEERAPSYSGSIADVSLPKLMYHFVAARTTGRLMVNNQSVHKDIYLSNGKVVGAASNLKRDQIGQHLLRAGVFSDEQLQQLVAQAAQAKLRLGEFLLRQKLIEPNAMYQLLQDQLREKVYEVFNWRVGSYAFFEGEQYQGALLPMNQNPWELVTEGVRRGYQLSELEKLFTPYFKYALATRDNQLLHASELGLHPLEQKVFREAGYRRLLEEILRRLGNHDNERMRVVLYTVYLGLELELLSIEQVEEEFEPLEEQAGEEWAQEMNLDVTAAGSSNLQASPPVSRQEQTLLEKLNQLKEQDLFQRLGLERNAGSAEVSKAFIKAARQYHPDNVPPEASDSLRQLTSQVFALLNEAQQKLSDEQQRQQYLQALEAGLEDDNVDVSNILEAESQFQRGENLLKARKYQAALDAFNKAVGLNPDEGEFHVYRGFALYMARGDDDVGHRRTCQEIILKGLQMRDNQLAMGFYFLGLIEKKAKNLERATKMFRKALRLDGKLIEASRELRLLQKRSQKKGGLFRR